jgi:hypothetical protein
MSNKQAVNWLTQQRVDVPDLKALDSSVIYDFATLLRCFQDGTPYILRGFTIPFVAAKTALQMVTADAILWAPGEAAGSFLKVDAGELPQSLTAANTRVIGSFADGALNFVGIRFKRAADPSTKDIVTEWDEDTQTEFTVTAPRGLVLNYEIVISQSDFGTNAPVAIVTINSSGQVTNIENCKNGMFRLGKGGATPDVNYNYNITTDPENPLDATSGSDPDNFAGGDWQIKNFKEWMDAVMTSIKKILGSAYWYSNGSSALSGVNLLDLWNDAVGSLITGAGKFQQGGPGVMTWTSDILIRSVVGPRTYIIPANFATLTDKQVAYITLDRNNDFQPANTFTFNNATNTVTGTIAVTGIIAGDWIKAVGHNEAAWRRVKLVAGNVITLYGPLDAFPNAQPIYPTNISGVKALKSVGSYTMQVDDPENVPADSDTYWIAKRDDNQFAALTITNVERTANISTITTSGPHSLVAGQMVAITGVPDTSFNINAEILSVTPTTFTYINNGDDVVSGPSSGTVSFVAILYVRGLGELNEGESISIDNQIPENILQYIGAAIDSQSSPIYGGVSGGSLNLPSYNTVAGENLTARLSKVTAMLADIQQNYNVEVDMGFVTWVANQVSINSAQLSIPGTTVGAAPVVINNVTNQALADNECLYVDINRSVGSALTVSAPTLLSALTPSQQRMVLVRRLGANIMVRG